MKPFLFLSSLFPILYGASFWVANIPSEGQTLPAQSCKDAKNNGLSFGESINGPGFSEYLPQPKVSKVKYGKKLPKIYNNGLSIEPKKYLPQHLPMQPFEGSYKDIARIGEVIRKASEKRTRITFFGASHTEGDFWTGHIRRVLQTRYGDLGHGFVMPAPPFEKVRFSDLNVCRSDGWHTGFVGREEIVDDSYYGLGMRAISDDPSQFAWVETTRSNPHGRAVSIFELLTLKQPGGGSLLVTLDNEQPILFPTLSDSPGLNRLRIDTFDSNHRLTINPLGDGPVRLFGISMERPGIGTLVDAIGIRGRTMRTWKYWDQTVLKDSLDALDPNIVVVAYGTNEASSKEYSMKQYRKDLRRSLEILKESRPEQICILVGPSDRGRKKGRKAFAVWERTIMVANIQREIAPEYGCVFWDWQQAQGGEGSMIAWRYTDPPLAAKDLIHHTRHGYIHMAEQFIKALDDAAQHYQ